MKLTIEILTAAVERDAAIVRVQRLHPVGGPVEEILPPSYPGERNDEPARRVFKPRRIDGMIDSGQSQA